VAARLVIVANGYDVCGKKRPGGTNESSPVSAAADWEMTQKRDVRPAGDDRNVRLAHLLSAICHFSSAISSLVTVPSIQPWGASVGRKSVF
jgi:hypothetical protein